MNVNPKTRGRIRTVLFMCGITFVFMSAVAALHLATAEAVARNASLYLQRAVLAAGGAALPQSPLEIPQTYEAQVMPRPGYFEILDPASRAVRSYAFVRNGAGLWGTITAVVGLAPDLRTVAGIMFIDQNETPGLGARISEDWFQEQFRGKEDPCPSPPRARARPTRM
jgi:Na+-transporting NADH:ubiquinone oxidoreductase subunit C